jgi:hypothetical protein
MNGAPGFLDSENSRANCIPEFRENHHTLATMNPSRTWGTRLFEDFCDGGVAVVEDLVDGAADEEGLGYGA